MTREEKIKAIYKEMANKEKTFGCKYIVDDGEERFIARETEGEELALGEDANTFVRGDDLAGEITRIHLIEIIGHPVMIGDMLERYRTNNNGYKYLDIDPYDLEYYYDPQVDDIRELLSLWADKRTPIEDQSDECIDYVYSLIQKD